MASLQDRIGPKVKKLHRNLTWKNPGADLQSPPKNTVEGSQSDENKYDNDDTAFSNDHHDVSSSQTFFPSRDKYTTHRRGFSRPRKTNRTPSLLKRMGISRGLSEDGMSDGEEAANIERSLLPQIGTTQDRPHHIGSTGKKDDQHVSDSNGYHDIANSSHVQRRSSSPQTSLLSSPNSQKNAFVTQKQQLVDNRDNNNLHDNLSNNQTTCVNPSIIEHDSNYSPSNITETSQTRNLATKNNMAVPPFSQEKTFEDGELVDSPPLPSQQVRDLLAPLILKNAAHRVKEGDRDLSRLAAHSVLTDEVCSLFMDQMKEVRTEMNAHKIRSSSRNPPHDQIQSSGETNQPGVPPPSKIYQAPPSFPHSWIGHTEPGKHMPPNGEIVTKSISTKDQPISASSSHSHDHPLSPSVPRRRERHTASPERRDFHDHDRGRRYIQHRAEDHRPNSRSCSPRYSRCQPFCRRPSDSSQHIARSRSPVAHVTSPRRRWSPLTQSAYLYDSPEDMSISRSISPHGRDRMPERRQSFSHASKRVEENISPHRDATDSLQSSVSHRHSDRQRAASRRRPSFTHGRDLSARRRRGGGSPVRSVRRSVSPRQKEYRPSSVDRPLHRTPPQHPPRPTIPNPYHQSSERHREPTPNSYGQPPEKHQEPRRSLTPNFERRQEPGVRPESLSPGAGSTTRGSQHQTAMVIDDQDTHGGAKEAGIELLKPSTPDDVQEPGLGVLPCHNVPGVWFVKMALDNIGTLECSFEVDNVTALNWNLQSITNINIPNGVDNLRKEKLQLHICCFSQKHVQSVMDTLKPDATAQDVATAMLEIENDWPTPGHLIIIINPENKNKRIWLPHKLEPPYLPVCIEDCVFEGQNTVQFIQLSGMPERMFVLLATARPLVDHVPQHDDHDDDHDDEFVLPPLQNTIDGGKDDIFNIGFGQVTISDLH